MSSNARSHANLGITSVYLHSKLGQGRCVAGSFQPRKRSGQALVSVVQQAYACGAGLGASITRQAFRLRISS